MRYLALLLLAQAPLLVADDGQRMLRVDHYVSVRSIAPSIKGQLAQIYAREVVQAGVLMRGTAGGGRTPVVLFIHGAGTPAEVAFDPPYRDYSWMAYLAKAGYDVFAMDMTGYGRSTRPHLMNDPCNLSKEQQAQFTTAQCSTAEDRVTTLESDWHDIGAVVEYVRKLRGVEKLNLVGWSLGGPRAGGYAAQHPEHVSRLVLLAPAYGGGGRATTAAPAANRQAPMNTQSREEFDANWDRQLGCPGQLDMAARESVWSEMLAADPVGATWGTGVRRAPNVGGSGQGWNREVVSKMKVPALFVAAALDKQALPERVRALYNDYGAADKSLVDLGCTSHNALWEKYHLLLFQVSLEWFNKGTANGLKSGEVKLGY